jgi:hypothetical protein
MLTNMSLGLAIGVILALAGMAGGRLVAGRLAGTAMRNDPSELPSFTNRMSGMKNRNLP